MITIIDYGVGNIFAFQNVYKRLNIQTKIAKTVEDLVDVKKLILPGVGAFDYAMSQLNKSGMKERLDELVLIQNCIPHHSVSSLKRYQPSNLQIHFPCDRQNYLRSISARNLFL